MPTYEYRCDRCGEQFEIFQPFSAKPLKRHADCGGPLQKVFHPRGVVFKGSGFYATDSRTKNGSQSKADQSNGDRVKGDGVKSKKTDKPKPDKAPAETTSSDS
jgi:putative FmdB family regulatory protein